MLADDAQPRLLASTALQHRRLPAVLRDRSPLAVFSAQRLYLTMPAVGTQLYFLAGYQVPSGDDSFRTVSLVHSFSKTGAAPRLVLAWSSFRRLEMSWVGPLRLAGSSR
uniref:Uncharacterized protein n=1 Tax=Zea mays TaxID=4577 RepID=A0A804RP37_MAIZE